MHQKTLTKQPTNQHKQTQQNKKPESKAWASVQENYFKELVDKGLELKVYF